MSALAPAASPRSAGGPGTLVFQLTTSAGANTSPTGSLPVVPGRLLRVRVHSNASDPVNQTIRFGLRSLAPANVSHLLPVDVADPVVEPSTGGPTFALLQATPTDLALDMDWPWPSVGYQIVNNVAATLNIFAFFVFDTFTAERLRPLLLPLPLRAAA